MKDKKGINNNKHLRYIRILKGKRICTFHRRIINALFKHVFINKETTALLCTIIFFSVVFFSVLYKKALRTIKYIDQSL